MMARTVSCVPDRWQGHGTLFNAPLRTGWDVGACPNRQKYPQVCHRNERSIAGKSSLSPKPSLCHQQGLTHSTRTDPFHAAVYLGLGWGAGAWRENGSLERAAAV